MRVKVRNNNVDGALRVLKEVQQGGFYTEMREREHYIVQRVKRNDWQRWSSSLDEISRKTNE